MSSVDCYAVVGNPIAHSKSPQIHRLFAEQTDQVLVYEAIRIDPEQTPFEYAVRQLMAKGYKGLNVTVPFKLDAYQFATELTERAKTAQAVNTLKFGEDGSILGDNTDGIGLVNDIEINGNRPFKDKRVLILGAGGAVQGILQPLLEKAPATVHIANRTAEKAQELAERFSNGIVMTASGWGDIPCEQGFDIIINGTSASLENKVPLISPACLKSGNLVYDMMYGPKPTVFIDWAKQHQPSCQVMDGLGMLVGQAAEAFYLWRGVRPETARVIQQIRESISA
ncbi:shikimate dehydrogenase [Hydrogenovibrio marinus]|uniref:Shikimate dehydrogenase (NADP(+)) n=1 Tax=Hydrogenovibrio marinus TaxID=28885 RepID=A0A066ZUJ0_HYDMR|nr:shikimate dehydrogenase [Hydrogenovibrio marinus]KDN95949.1 shikimate dehydrogenase [Hydrogenovibrio marinus]BBN58559.1 shikimate dehydrogenase (NADP(+)) [Hydrogenovibrio marinus]